MAGSSGGNQTTRTEPPKYQLPYLQDSLSRAQNEYNRTSGGNTVAPFSPETLQAFQGITARATGGSDLTRGAQSLAQNTLSGGFLGSNPYTQQLGQFSDASNPQLDNTFNRAALATQNQLASQFARSGRNVEASEGLRSQQLNDLATGIYGNAYESDQNRALQALGMQQGAYDSERTRQMQALGMAPGLAQQDYFDLGQLANVGAQREMQDQRMMDQPGQSLDDYIRRISGNMGQTTITPTYQNRGAGLLGGALAGAQLGSIFPGVGPVLGGIGGGILGGWG